jgi:hypothetical protein
MTEIDGQRAEREGVSRRARGAASEASLPGVCLSAVCTVASRAEG